MYNVTIIKDPTTLVLHLVKCQEIADSLEPMSHIAINFNLIYYS